MDRKELACKCLRIEAAGGCVRQFLRDLGFVSPWGTWFRLQKEELGRKDWQITDGKGVEEMRKVTLEDKKKAVEIALSGGDPLAYLKEIGSKQPSALWYAIKKALKEVDPEKYELLVPPPASEEIRMPEEAPEKTLVSSEDIKKALDECGIESSIKNAVEYGGFEVIVLKSPCTGFRYTNDQQAGKMTWNTTFGNTVSLTAEDWHNMAAELPKVLQIFGI
jgi:hypothetical protein